MSSQKEPSQHQSDTDSNKEEKRSHELEEEEEAPPSIADDVSETPTERYQRSVNQTKGTWFSGFFSGNSYIPHPKKVKEEDLSDDAEHDLLEEETYIVPRGYKYHVADLPPILSQKPVGKYKTGLIVYLVCEIIAFVFLLASSTNIPWYKGKDVTIDDINYKGAKYTLYNQKGGGIVSFIVRDLRFCPREKQFFQTISASTIMATMFTLIALVLTIVRLAGKTSYVWSMIFGFFGFMWALCGNALSISLFHIGRCNEPRLANVARLDAGFALSLIAWILLMVGLLVMTFVTQCNFGPAIRHVRVMDSFYLLLLIMVIALCAIGNVTTIWKRHFGDDKVRVVRVSYWHTEVILADGVNLIYGRAAYRCSAYNKRIKASVSFLILATVFFAIAAFLAIPAFFKRGMRILSLCLSITACVMLLISWVIAVVVKYRKLCENDVGGTVYENYPGVPTGVFNGYTKFEGYGLAEGVVLQIVAWILSLLAIILNFAIPWPAKK